MPKPRLVFPFTEVVRCIDGDTFVPILDLRPLLRDIPQILPTVRLAGVNAAEMNRAGGAGAKTVAEKFFAEGEAFELIVWGIDKYGRVLGGCVRLDDRADLTAVILKCPGSKVMPLTMQLAPED